MVGRRGKPSLHEVLRATTSPWLIPFPDLLPVCFPPYHLSHSGIRAVLQQVSKRLEKVSWILKRTSHYILQEHGLMEHTAWLKGFKFTPKISMTGSHHDLSARMADWDGGNGWMKRMQGASGWGQMMEWRGDGWKSFAKELPMAPRTARRCFIPTTHAILA